MKKGSINHERGPENSMNLFTIIIDNKLLIIKDVRK